MTVGQRLAQLRKAAGETQQKTAERAGCSRATIAGIEAGTQEMGLGVAQALATHFEVLVDYLLVGSEPTRAPADAALRESHDRLHKALADLVNTFRARPDMLKLCGPEEQSRLANACYALDFSVGRGAP